MIWNTPLDYYLEHTVAEIRQLKTHGEKRVRVVMEVFCNVHDILSRAEAEDHLSVRLVPKFIEPIERWISQRMQQPTLPSAEETDIRVADDHGGRDALRLAPSVIDKPSVIAI